MGVRITLKLVTRKSLIIYSWFLICCFTDMYPAKIEERLVMHGLVTN